MQSVELVAELSRGDSFFQSLQCACNLSALLVAMRRLVKSLAHLGFRGGTVLVGPTDLIRDKHPTSADELKLRPL